MNVSASQRMKRVFSSLSSKPSYTLMRFFARFTLLRYLVPKVRNFVLRYGVGSKVNIEGADYEPTLFPDIDAASMVADLKQHGVAFGLKLPNEIVASLRSFADNNMCFADRDPASGFSLNDRERAEKLLGKKILVAQYFNTVSECSEVVRLIRDPVLNQVARGYLGSTPKFVGANLWWTFPVDATQEDRNRHAHLFHRDVDDFRFFKFFFYLTDVEAGDGAHVCVLGSQGKPPTKHLLDRWNIRRYSDDEVNQQYDSGKVTDICGKAGDGFAEDTWCIHKGKTPVNRPRLLLQLQFALFDYGAMHDQRDEKSLKELM
ncbi:hypothetical protein [Marinobacter sediminicola]|uniref:hypothetical protein n=1 Tax=Marinobacter sediminicola TaxID=3072994 RepID=UPI002810EAFF|nr:hypothetical protein [Marinobacter sp. F26243]